jgi:chromosomal replication initiator protein
MYTICNLLAMPLLSIGQLFGRDHTTVIHARDKISQAIEESPRVKVAVDDIRALATKS